MDPNELLSLISGESQGVNPEASPSYASMLGYGAPQPEPALPVLPSRAVAEPVTSPTQVPEAGPDNASTPANQRPGPLGSVAMGAKIGVSGYSPEANAAIQKGPQSTLEKGLVGDQAAVKSEFAPIQKDMRSATDLASDAKLAEAGIESAKFTATSKAHTQIAAAQQDFLTKEKAAVDNARAEAEASKAQYRTALMEFSAARVNPSQLWEASGKEGQFAMIATAFLHDFLGAKGIKTSGLDSINQAIKNNIAAQVENINNKKDVAAGFKQLWDMQRVQSASDTEARQRMHGFYLEGLKNEIEGKVGAYDSDLALAKGQAAVAELRKEQVKNDLLVQQHIDKTANERAERRIDVYKAGLAASSARYTADAHIRAAEIAAGAKDKSHPLDGVIFDTSKSGGNTAIRRFLPDVKPEERSKLREQTANTLDTVKNIEKLIELQDEAGRVPPTDISAIKKLQNETKRTAELVRSTTRMGIIYNNSGKQINEQEMKLYDEIVGKKDWWVNGDNVRTLGTLAKQSLEKNNAVMGAVSIEIPEGDPAYGFKSGTKGFDPANSALTDIQSGPNAGRPEETDTKQYTKWSVAPNALQAFDPKELSEQGPGNRHQVLHDWAKFREDSPWAAPNEKADVKRRLGPGKGDIENIGTAANPENPDRAFIQMERLADLALQGDTKAKQTIEQFASKHASTANLEGLLSAYAQWEISTKGLDAAK